MNRGKTTSASFRDILRGATRRVDRLSLSSGYSAEPPDIARAAADAMVRILSWRHPAFRYQYLPIGNGAMAQPAQRFNPKQFDLTSG